MTVAKLYLVGTPIGNLGDMSPRAVEILGEVAFIAAEDTRVTRKLLSHFGIHKPLVSYHEHNMRDVGDKLLSRLLAGEDAALVSDAGMPCISDPGEQLVRLCAEHGVEVVAVPGPSAAVTAVALSGLPSGRFSFEGFLSVQKGSRMEHLAMVREDPRTLVFYEAPHKLPATLRDMLDAFGERRISLCREITKLHEEVWRTTLGEAAAHYSDEGNKPRGEFVLVIEGAAPRTEERVEFPDAVAMVRTLMGRGASASQAAKEVAQETGYKKGELYKAALE